MWILLGSMDTTIPAPVNLNNAGGSFANAYNACVKLGAQYNKAIVLNECGHQNGQTKAGLWSTGTGTLIESSYPALAGMNIWSPRWGPALTDSAANHQSLNDMVNSKYCITAGSVKGIYKN
jgi:hypothetical protein